MACAWRGPYSMHNVGVSNTRNWQSFPVHISCFRFGSIAWVPKLAGFLNGTDVPSSLMNIFNSSNPSRGQKLGWIRKFHWIVNFSLLNDEGFGPLEKKNPKNYRWRILLRVSNWRYLWIIVRIKTWVLKW